MKKSINLNGLKTKVEFSVEYDMNNIVKIGKGLRYINSNKEVVIYTNYFIVETFTINGDEFEVEKHVAYKKNKFNSHPDTSYYYMVNGNRVADNHKKIIESLLN
tara:strand:+ start:72 stop:383 length:312 start_codon:yes stop_codon:yes gene_type:complete